MKMLRLCVLLLAAVASAFPAAADVVVLKGSQRVSGFENEGPGWEKLKGSQSQFIVIDYNFTTFEVADIAVIFYGKLDGNKFYTQFPIAPEDFSIVDVGGGNVGAAWDQELPDVDPVELKVLGNLFGKHTGGSIKNLKGTLVAQGFDGVGNRNALQTIGVTVRANKQFDDAATFADTVLAITDFLESKGYQSVPF